MNIKAILSKVLFLFILSFLSFSQQEKSKFSFEFETYDLGRIPSGIPVTIEFPFSNVGGEPLIITNSSATCGCTKPVVPAAPIMPGEKGSVSVGYDAKRIGSFRKTITILSNSDTPTKYLFIKGEVYKQ